VRWKNYGLWVSIASVLYMVLKDLGYQIDLTRWETYVTAILGILVSLGVISNPENGKGYFTLKSAKSASNTPPEEEASEISSVSSKTQAGTGEYIETDSVDFDANLNGDQEDFHDRKYIPYEK